MFRNLFQPSDQHDLAALRRSLSSGDRQAMDRVMSDVERRKSQTENAELLYELGVALRNYTTWFVRGDERAPLLRRAADYFRRAYAAGVGQLPDRDARAPLDRERIAIAAGMLLADEACIRDLDAAIAFLAPVYRATRGYEPGLCWYADALYKRGDYQQAATVAVSLHQRALRSAEWRDRPPPAPLQIAAKAYRALAKAAKKAGAPAQAVQHLQTLVDLGVASDADRRLLASLRG